jgi:hypothetical protein
MFRLATLRDGHGANSMAINKYRNMAAVHVVML